MAQNRNFVIGSQSDLKLTIVPASLIDTISATTSIPNVTVTSTATASISATTISVTAITGAIPAHTPLTFTKSGSADVKCYTTSSAAAGATTLNVTALPVAMGSTGYTATYTSMLSVAGVTSANTSISNNGVQSYTFGSALGFSDEITTTASWQLDLQANVLPTSDSYYRISKAAQNAVAGVLVLVHLYDPTPSGYTSGDIFKGVATVQNFSKASQADQIITYSATLKGVGAPDFTPAS